MEAIIIIDTRTKEIPIILLIFLFVVTASRQK